MEAVTQLAYLDHAAMAPVPRRVHEAMARYLAGRRQYVGFDLDEEFETVSTGLGKGLAKLINATPKEIGFVQNTSHGLNIAAQSLPLEPEDNVIFCDMEFPANVYPWMLLSEQRGVEARCIPHDGGGLTVEALEYHADERTRVVTVSSVEFLTGFQTDLAAIGRWCKERDIIFVVDGIQSVGAAPMDVQACQIDFLASGAVKWLMGPMGIGFIYCRQELLEQLTPPMAGALSVMGWEDWRDYDLTFPPDARRFYLGGPNFVGMTGMMAAVELLLETGIDEIYRWTLHLTDQLIADLRDRGYVVASNLDPAHRSAIVSLSVPGDPKAALTQLREAGVVVSMREEYIRVSPHGYNTEDEIARVGHVLGDA
jgi:selenocysteine lyase/cysteine desulfurase